MVSLFRELIILQNNNSIEGRGKNSNCVDDFFYILSSAEDFKIDLFFCKNI